MSSPASNRRRGTSQRNSTSSTPVRPRATNPAAPANNPVPSSSPLFFQSSPANGSQQGTATAGGANRMLSSPPPQLTSDIPDLDRTPRASRQANGESSPIRYVSSSSPTRGNNNLRSDVPSSSSGFFIRERSGFGSSGAPQLSIRRGNIHSDAFGSTPNQRRRIFVGDNGIPTNDPGSEATFSNLNPDTSEADALGGDSTRVIWGTNIALQDSMNAFRSFLFNYARKYRMWADGASEAETSALGAAADEREYLGKLQKMLDLGVTGLNLDIKNLKAYPATLKLWHQIVAYPQEMVPLMDQTLKEAMMDLAAQKMEQQRSRRQREAPRVRHSSSLPPGPSSDINSDNIPSTATPIPAADDTQNLVAEVELRTYKVLPFGLDKAINMRDLDPQDMDKLVSIKGLVIRATPIIPDMKDAFFKCTVCEHTVKVDIDRGKIAEPTICPRRACASKESMRIVHNRSTFADKQIIKLQETPDNVPDGQTPHSVSLCVYDELVDFCKAGDRILVTGIFRSNPVRVNPRQRAVKSLFKTYIDVLHIQKTDKRKMGIDVSTVEQEVSEAATGEAEQTRKITEEEKEKIEATGRRPDVYELLARSLAPSIYEMDDVKKGILLQLFGGTNKTFQKGGSPKYRGDINILLCGDPSTSKSQLLTYVHRIAPRGVYTSGKGSSAVGLTAYVTRDPESRQLVLESGALVLSDGGVCCIDEFDKMNESTRSVLHEVMEQQTVSIAKAGIITTLNARTSILASANPIGSRYNPNLPVPQNIDLPPTLLSRFDLVYLVLDRVDESNDRRLAKHLVGMYLEDTPENASNQEILPIDFLTAYITYARANYHPTLSPTARQALVDSYVSLRGLGADDLRSSDRRITATTRQLESMIRLSEAHAKMRLSRTVETLDVNEAVRLIRSAIKESATDKRTGLIDMGLLTEGLGSVERRRREDIKRGVLEVLDSLLNSGAAAATGPRWGDVFKRLNEEGSGGEVEGAEFAEAIRSLESEGKVTIGGAGVGGTRVIRRVTGVL